MYTKFFGLRGNPFTPVSGSRLLYLNATYQEAYVKLLDWVYERRGAAVLTGEAGTGKSTLLRSLMASLEADPTVRCLFFSYTALSFPDLVNFVCQDVGLEIQKEEQEQYTRILTDFLQVRSQQGETIALLIDEAHSLSEDVLANLPLLMGPDSLTRPLLQIILCGQQPGLEDKLSQPSLDHLRKHLSLQCKLNPLTSEETQAYIHHRLQTVGYEGRALFHPHALQLIFLYSKGIPRVINEVCEQTLQMAYAAAQKTIAVELVTEAIYNLQFQGERAEVRANHEKTQPALIASAKAILRAWGIQLSHLFALRNVWIRSTAVFLTLLCLALLTSRFAETTQPQPESPSEASPATGSRLHEPPLLPEAEPSLISAGPPVLELIPSSFATPHAQAAKRGHEIFAMLRGRYPKIHPFVWGLLTPQPAVALFIPDTEWNALSKEDQVSLTLYVESLISRMKANPNMYLAAFRAESNYADLRNKVANLCADCWVVGVGRLTLDQQGVLLDRVVVQGDSVWDKSEPHDRGTKASEFRHIQLAHASGERSDPLAESQHTAAEKQQSSFAPQDTVVPAGTDESPPTTQEVTSTHTDLQESSPEILARTTAQDEPKVQSRMNQFERSFQIRARSQRQGGDNLQTHPKKEFLLASRRPALVAPTYGGKEHKRDTEPSRRGQQQRVPYPGKALLAGTENGDLYTVQSLLKAGVSPNEQLPGGWTALMMAAIHGRTAIAKVLLNHGADVHVKNNRGMTALMFAAWNKHTAVVQLLLKHGARTGARDQNGWTALQYAQDHRLKQSGTTEDAIIVALLQDAKLVSRR